MILRARQSRRPVAFDMTPMIDVVLQLIIFFLFTSQLSQTARSPIDLPEEAGEDSPERPGALVIDVTGQGGYVFEGETRTLEDLARLVGLEQRAAEAGGGRVELLIRADRSAPALYINRLADRLAGEGVRRWSLGTAQPVGGGGG
jgi:biopolymer transport protein ExbD